MFEEFLDKGISAIVDSLEDFFDVVTYPSRKYIETAIYIALGFLGFSIVGLWFDFFVFVNWYEAITAVILLAIVYFVSDISGKQVSEVTSLMQAKTTKFIKDTKKSINSSKKKSKKKKKATNKKK